MDSSKSKGKQKGLADKAGYVSSDGGNSNASKGTTTSGIVDSSKSKGKQKGLADKAGYASSGGGNDNSSKGSNSTKGTKKLNLPDSSGYAMASPPPTQKKHK